MFTSVTTQKVTARKPAAKSFWTFHNVNLKLHLWLGLASAVFLLILAVTGSIIAFEVEIERWLHRSLYYVQQGTQPLPESRLIQEVEQRFAPGKVRHVVLPRSPKMSQIMQVAGAGGPAARRDTFQAWVNPYTGAIVGTRTGPSKTQRVLQFIHQFHLHMGLADVGKMGDLGKLLLSIASAILLFEAAFGILLWWKLKRATIKLRKASWFRVCFDLHNVLGIYSAVFLVLISFTGVLIGFEWAESAIFKITHSEPLLIRGPVHSKIFEGATPISVDRAIDTALQQIPNTTVTTIQPPAAKNGVYAIGLRTWDEFSDAVHSTVWIDQYSGSVLRVQNFDTASRGYRVIRWNRSLHTGDVLGFGGHMIMSLTSIALVGMVITGVVIWWKKLAI